MPNLKTLPGDTAAMTALAEEMSNPDPVREEPKLNHGIRCFEELEQVVCRAPFADGDDVELAQVHAAARAMASRR
jgi:hypothetical protein